jgi:hypothetical protein
MGWRRSVVGPLALGLLVGAPVIGGAGCGDDGRSDSGTANARTAGGGINAAERDAISQVMPKLRDAINARDWKGYCAQLSPAGQREVNKAFGSALGVRSQDCAVVVRSYLADKDLKTLPAVQTKRIAVKGSKAWVTISSGRRSRPVTLTLVRSGQTWKLDNPISQGRPGFDAR